MEFPEHMAHSMLQTIYSIPSIHSIHSRVSPHPVHCAKLPASQQNTQPCALETPGNIAHTQPSAIRPIGPIRPIRPIPALLPPCALRNVLCQPTEHTALCYRNSKAHGTQAAIDHLQYSRYSQYSWFLCPHPVHCAMRSANRS